MPETIAAIAAYAIPTATAAAGTYAAIGTIAYAAAMVAYSAAQSSKARKQQKEAFNAAQVDRMANVVTTTGPRELVLGRVRKGGPIAFRGSAGTLNETFLVHVVLAAHEIDAVEQVYLNDEPVSLTVDGYVDEAPYRQYEKVTEVVTLGSVTAGQVVVLDHPPLSGTISIVAGTLTGSSDPQTFTFSVAGSTVTINEASTTGEPARITYQWRKTNYFARIWWDLGGGTAVADARTVALFPTEWTAAHRGQGIAKLIAEFTYNETAFPNGIPAITARIRGAKVYDPRDATTAWSENPALLARHVYQHPHFGKATVSSDEDDRFIAAANACDVSHDYVVGPGSDIRALYTAGMVAQFGAPANSILDDLCQAMAGMHHFAGGELYVRAGVYTAPVMTLTDSDLAIVQRQGDSESQDQMTISVHRERAEKFNTLNVRIWDQEQDYRQVALTPVKGAALITRDGAELAQELTLSAVSHAGQAQHVAGVMMRDARDPLTVEAPFKMTAYPLELFDTVNLTLARYGWVNKTFMVLGRTWLHDKGVIKLTLKETTASIFTPDASFLPQGRADNTRLPRPWDIEPPVLTEAGVYSGTDELLLQSDGTIVSRMRLTWAALTDKRLVNGGFIDVQSRAVGNSQWQTVTVDGSATEAIIAPVRDNRVYILRARSRTSVAVSDWSDQVAHVVIGKTEDPTPVDRFKVIGQPGGIKRYSWSVDDQPLDARSFVVRYSLGSTERPWDSMLPLFSTDKNARVRETAEPFGEGAYTFAIRQVDTTGNYSEPVYASGTFKAFGEVALLVLPHQDGWAGTRTSCFVSGTSLIDIGTATWNDIPATWNDLETWADLWSGFDSVSPISYEHTVIDMTTSAAWEFRISSLAEGATLSEYAYSADGITYSDWAESQDEALTVTGRYFKFRWTVTGSAPALHLAQVIFYA